MKYLLLLLLFFGLWVNAGAQVKEPAAKASPLLGPPTVDERVELLSIVARIAEFKEYDDSSILAYVQAIHRHFDPYKNHPVILLARQLRDSTGLGYDALMGMAVHLSQPPALSPLVSFSDSIPDTRWGKAFSETFVSLLQRFYTEAHCQAFFDSVRPMYEVALQRYNTIFSLLDIDWYKKYYGLAPHTTFHVVLGMGNGGGNYGSKVVYPSGHEDAYAIEGVSYPDSMGKPTFPLNEYLPILIHEFNHSFVNYLTDLHRLALTASGNVIYDSVQAVMNAQAYGGWSTMESEALVRASVVRYLMAHPQSGLIPDVQTLDEELFHGFFWMHGLVSLLGSYESNRGVYGTLNAFMPQIVYFYDTLAPQIAVFRQRENERISRGSIQVVKMGPFQPGDSDVSPALRDIYFTFDRPFVEGRYSFGPVASVKGAYPTFKGVSYSADHKTITLHVELKPNTFYSMYAGGRMFRSTDGYPAGVYKFTFKTGPE